MELELADKAWARKKKRNSCKFSQSHARKRLNQIYISLWLITPPQGGKAKHHWGSRRIECQGATLYEYESCVNLSNGKQNSTYTSRCRAVEMQLYR
jgi:hypothetical protein